jgi:hypothetical protein
MKYPNVGVYYDSGSVRYQFSQFKTVLPLKDFESFDTEELFFNSALAKKIAAVHVPYPFDLAFIDKVNRLRLYCDHVYVIATEVHPEIVEFIRNSDHANITFYICGLLNFEMKNAQVKQFMDWFETSTYFYRHWLPEILTRLRPFETKYRAFDILLGRKKLHRDELFRNCQTQPGIGIVTYFNDHNTQLGNNPEEWIWEHTGVRVDKTPEWTVDRVNYYGHTMSLSQIIPINIYNQTAYSVIAETCFHHDFAFFTEKTVKPIIAKRLFVMFAGQYYLANLRKLGFKTFDGIIDESYDEEFDVVVRSQLAWEQMVWLANQPQEQILKQIRPIVEHNFEVMMTNNWATNFRQEFEKDIKQIITKI